jgi:2-polyprenyl-6-methoxyphenol hydroxylase-like FAD-dependent oxidoreductase
MSATKLKDKIKDESLRERVLIVGAGPAGASVAKNLYGSGLDVVIIEKAVLMSVE